LSVEMMLPVSRNLSYLQENNEVHSWGFWRHPLHIIIRSSSQDDTDGTSSIILPCPGS
jgi:hypothetical protein